MTLISTPSFLHLLQLVLHALGRGLFGAVCVGLYLSQSLSAAAPVITSSLTAHGIKGIPFSYQITATNAPTSFNSTLGVPSVGITFATGVIHGMPSSEGTFTMEISATNGDGTGSATLVIAIGPPLPAQPVITSMPYALAVLGRPFSYQISATNSPTSFDSGSFGNGLSLNQATGVLSGIPTRDSGWVASSIRASNAVGMGYGDLLIAFAPETTVLPTITGPESATAIVGRDLTLWLSRSGEPVLFDASGLPPGLAMAYNLGALYGTPTFPGVYTVNLIAMNAAGTGHATLTLTVTTASSYAAWTLGYAFSGDTANMASDPDGDGLVNLLEYALGTDPLQSSAVQIPQLEATADSLVFSHRHNKTAEVAIAYEVSTDLVTWTPTTLTTSVVDPDVDGDGKVELVRALLPLTASDTRKFIRLAVTAP